MEQKLEPTRHEVGFNVVKHLATKLKMTDYEVMEYIELLQRLFDNLLFMGIDIEMPDILKVEHIQKGRNDKIRGLNKIYIEGLVRGEYEKQYICTKQLRRRVQSKSSVTKKPTYHASSKDGQADD